MNVLLLNMMTVENVNLAMKIVLKVVLDQELIPVVLVKLQKMGIFV